MASWMRIRSTSGAPSGFYIEPISVLAFSFDDGWLHAVVVYREGRLHIHTTTSSLADDRLLSPCPIEQDHLILETSRSIINRHFQVNMAFLSSSLPKVKHMI